MTQETDRPALRPLPRPDAQAGKPQRIGVEIEFSGMTETRAASVVQDLLGGQITEDGDFSVQITTTELGDVEILLDTALRKYSEAGLDAARVVVPIELGTAP